MYDNALRINPSYAEAYMNKGMILYLFSGIALASLGKLHEAIKMYDNALRINPNNSNA